MTAPRQPNAGAPPPVVREVPALRRRLSAWREAGRSIALVPTMGAIHGGHLALIERAKSAADKVVASLFVNPLQFGAAEDFASYPRDEVADLLAFEKAGVDLVYAPTAEAMFGPGFATKVSVSGLTSSLCGPERPGHFDGVATVVAKLLLQCLPDMAMFGEKDYQQLVVVRRLVRDLDIPCEIIGVPTVRDADGLALSSRNAYLGARERAIAGALNRVLREAAARLAGGAEPAPPVIEWAIAELESAGFSRVDYVALCRPETLEPLLKADGPARLLAAVRLGTVRLIDNVPL